MDNKKDAFCIAPKKDICETTTATIRLPKPLLAEFDDLASESGYSRNEVMVMGLRYAMEHLEQPED